MKRRILVIEDDEGVRRLIREVLTEAGYEVQEASDGKVGLELLKKQSAELLISDILMPNKDGFETIMALRKEHPGIKIIAISGGRRYGSFDYLDVARTFGAQRTLAKPFDPAVLVETVRELLEEPSP